MNESTYSFSNRFFKTAPIECPYLPNRNEQLIFTHLNKANRNGMHSLMTHAGFRRSHGIVYRPNCIDCAECVPVRVRTKDFKLNKSQKRIFQRNIKIGSKLLPAVATKEHYELFLNYQRIRHSDGNMALMTFKEYQAMVEETPVNTKVLEYRENNNSLFAVALTDFIQGGLSMVYSFYRPNAERQSPGIWIILEHIHRAKTLRLPYVYLGYLIQDCSKMAYKEKFQPLEALSENKWTPIK